MLRLDRFHSINTFFFNLRWTAIAWPHKIERQMEATYEQLDQDEERFRKLQTSDQANFNDRLDTLQVSEVKNKILPEITGTKVASWPP